jgi:hypothetical protein
MKFTTTAQALVEGIESAALAANPHNITEQLTMVRFELGPTSLKVTGTDGFILIHCRIPGTLDITGDDAEHPSTFSMAVANAKDIHNRLPRYTARSGDIPVELTVDNQPQIPRPLGGWVIWLTSGTDSAPVKIDTDIGYPDYSKMIPKLLPSVYKPADGTPNRSVFAMQPRFLGILSKVKGMSKNRRIGMYVTPPSDRHTPIRFDWTTIQDVAGTAVVMPVFNKDEDWDVIAKHHV